MTLRRVLMLVATLAAAFAVAMILRSEGQEATSEATPDAPAKEVLPETSPNPLGASREEVEAALAAMEEERLALRTAYRAFAEDARRMTDEEKAEEGARLLAEVDASAARDELVGDQPLYMKLAIYRVLYDRDDAAFARAAAAARAERAADVAARPEVDHGPLHRRYKDEEARIVREVLAMETFPDGLDRDAYLAQRLEEARAEIYRDGER